jgi:hypothetical protein
MTRALLAATAILCLAAPPAGADEVRLLNGDRISGRVVGKPLRRVRLQTPYGVLVIPREKVDRIIRDDGSEEVLNAPKAPPTPKPPPPPPPIALVLVVTGHTFWQAWDPKAAPADPSLRLEVWLDEQVAASYTDVNLDPEDLPKAVVNSFVFSPERLFVRAGEGVTAAPPELVSGEIRLRLRLPGTLAGPRRLRAAYQVNDATSAEPRWRDVVVAATEVTLEPGGSAELRLAQDRGTMEYTRGRMRNVETFAASLEPEGSP